MGDELFHLDSGFGPSQAGEGCQGHVLILRIHTVVPDIKKSVIILSELFSQTLTLIVVFKSARLVSLAGCVLYPTLHTSVFRESRSSSSDCWPRRTCGNRVSSLVCQ